MAAGTVQGEQAGRQAAVIENARLRLALGGLVHALRHEQGFSPLTCSGALFSALGVAENELEAAGSGGES